MPKTRTNWLRRNNETVERAVALLVEQGVVGETDEERDRAGRRIEDHSRRHLLPPGNPTPEVLAAHEAELLKVDRRGPGASNRTAFIMLAHGFPVDLVDRERLPREATDLDPDTDEGSQLIENEAAMLIESHDNGPSAKFSSKVVTRLRENVKKAPAHDPWLDRPTDEDPAEDPEITLRSGVAQLIAMNYGGSAPPTLEALMAITGRKQPDRVDDYPGLAPDVWEALGDAMASMTELAEEASAVPMTVKVQGAMLLRRLLRVTQAMSIVVFRDPDELDELAGRLYPLGVAMLQIGFPELLAAIEEAWLVPSQGRPGVSGRVG